MTVLHGGGDPATRLFMTNAKLVRPNERLDRDGRGEQGREIRWGHKWER